MQPTWSPIPTWCHRDGSPQIAVSPSGLGTVLVTGGTATQIVTVRNLGGGTLDFSVPTPQFRAVTTEPGSDPALAKGAPETGAGEVVPDNSGGPDGLGYRWVDSDQPGGPAFHWVDITSVGTLVRLRGDDATSAPIP